MLLKSETFILLLAGISSSLCDYGGSVHDLGYEFAYYHSNGDKVDYVGALIKCETAQNPGWLAETKDPEFQLAVERVVYGNGDVWIGATDLSAEGRWLWLDTTELYWTNWEAGEPNNLSDEDCLLMLSSGEWNDKDCCYRAHGYVCQIPEETLYKFGYSEFETVRSPGNFWQAKQACADNGARLVEVADRKSEEYLRKLLKFGEQPIWVAGTMKDASRCLTINKDGTDETDCSKLKPAFLCEKVRPHTLKVSQRKVSAPLGSLVEVNCTAEGYPTPGLVWYKDGQEIVTQMKSPGRSRLVVERAGSNDAGLYTCYATNNVNKGRFEVKAFMDLEVATEE